MKDVLQSVPKRSHQHRKARPRHQHRVVPAPLHLMHVPRRTDNTRRVELRQAALEVGRDDPEQAGEREEGEGLAVRGGRHVREGAAGDALVEALEVVDAVDGRVDGEEDFDVTGDGLVGRDDGP